MYRLRYAFNVKWINAKVFYFLWRHRLILELLPDFIILGIRRDFFFSLLLCKTNPRLPFWTITPFFYLWLAVFYLTFCSNISHHCRLSVLRWWEWWETCKHQRHSEFLKPKLHHGSVLNTCVKDFLAILFCIASQRECPGCFPRERQWSHSKSTNPVTICRCRQASETLCASPQTVLSVILGPAHSL